MTDDPPRLYNDITVAEIDTFRELDRCLTLPLTGSMIRRIFLLLMRVHYSSGTNYPDEYAHLRCMTWAPVAKDSTLTVDVINLFNDRAPDAFPGIYVGIVGNQSETVVIGNQGGDSDDGSRQHVVTPNKVTLRIVHVARSEGDATDLADMSMVFLKAMAPLIAGEMQSSAIRVNGYGTAEKKSSASDRFYAVDLSVSVSYNLRVATILEGHRIGSIQIAASPNTPQV